MVARESHKLKVAGSIPASATIKPVLIIIILKERGDTVTKQEASEIVLLSGSEEVGTAIDFLMENYPKEIGEFTKEDFLDSTMPLKYIDLYAYDRVKRNQIKQKVKDRAVELKIGARAFEHMWTDYKKVNPDKPDEDGNFTNFPEQPLILSCGKWICDCRGVRMDTEKGEIWACLHPIMPIERLKNVNTGIEKIKVAFYDKFQWKTVIVDRKTVSVASKITDLSDFGIAATSENASHLVKYFLTTLQSNTSVIPELKSVTHLGWTENNQFVPYAENIEFDGEKDFVKRYKAVTTRGFEETWFNCVGDNVLYSKNPVARMVFAAGFASVLVKLLNANNFWLHLWGGSGTAKTVLAMCTASAWANPTIGEYITTFNSTYVGNERGAAFCGSMPYMLDELQILDNRKDMDSLIYMLTEGAGRNRGNRSGGIDNVSCWKNCVISTGERPINSQSSGGGAAARVIEIEVKTPLFDEKTAKAIVDVITQNYGFFGKKYVEIVNKISVDELKKRYNDLSSKLISRGIMDKQAQSGAIIMLANALIAEFLKNEDLKLKVDDMIPFLKTKEEVDVCKRAYDFICGKVVENQTKFAGEVERQTEIWGKFNSNDQVCIIKTKFDAICTDGGFAPKPLLSWLADKNLIKRDGQNQFTVPIYVGTKTTRCVVLTLLQTGNDSGDDDILDF